MNQCSGILRGLLLALLMIVFFLFSGNAQTNERSAVLKNCNDLFGPPVDVGRNLFEINPHYILKVRFDSQGKLIALAFLPKYFLNEIHPEWKRPEGLVYLPKAEYEDLLRRLDKISPKGELIKTMPYYKSHGFTTDTLDQYEYAILFRNDLLFEGGRGASYGSLYFFHEVEGKVRRKLKYNWFIPRDAEDYYYQVSIGKLSYFVHKEDYLKLRVGRVAKFMAVGPTEGIYDY